MATSSEIVVRELSENTKVLQYEMRNEMSEHPNARLVCEVSQAFQLQELAECDKQIHIERTDTGETIFTGYVDDAALEERQSGYFILDLSLIGGSILLDQKKKYRSYQDVTLKHKDIIEEVMKDVPEVTLKCELTDDKEIGKPLIQYGETDWEFIKRVASRVNEPTFVDETTLLPYLHTGRKSGCATGRSVDARCVSEGMDARFYRLGEFAKENGRAAYYFYKLTGKDNYYIGEQVAYNGSEFYICEKEARLEQEELLYTYTLAKDTYMKIPPLYNPRLTGASVLGTIKNVSGETMELALNLKDEVDSSVRYAYDWRPEVGNLMYCMPKVETVVSLYFPSNDEQDAYAVNCVRKIEAEKESLFDETTKTFLTEDGKLLAMASSALHLCAVNQESESGDEYAQLSMVDTMTAEEEATNSETAEVVTEREVTVEDILEKMGLMLAGSHDVQMVGASIRLESAYVDLFAGGKISIMTGALEEGSKANASVELSAAYFSITADGDVVFALEGRIGENTFCLIWDEPKKAADGWQLGLNVFIGIVAVGLVAAACLFALPAVLTLAGVATATASTIAMGAAVGAAATGAFAIVEQYNRDKERGEASSLGDTFLNALVKSVAGAAEGGFMAIAGAGSIVTEGTRFLCKQTLKNIGKNLLINQAGSFIASSGNVLADAVTGDGITMEEAIDYYCEGFVGGLFSSALDVGKAVPWKKLPGVENMCDWVNQNVIDRVKQGVKNTSLYRSYEAQIAKLMKWAGYYGEYDDYGNADARLASDIANNEASLTQSQNNLNGLSDDITDAQGRVASTQGDLDSLMNRQADIEDQLDTLTRGLDDETDELIADLMGERHYLNGQQEYFEQRVQDAIQRLNTLTNRQTTNRNRVGALMQDIAQDKATRNADRWGTFAVCSVIKFFDDRIQDFVKKQEPIASITEGTKDVGQWMFETKVD